VARRKERLDDIASKCLKNGASDVLPLVLDLSDASNNEKVVDETVKRFQSKCASTIWQICVLPITLQGLIFLLTMLVLLTQRDHWPETCLWSRFSFVCR